MPLKNFFEKNPTFRFFLLKHCSAKKAARFPLYDSALTLPRGNSLPLLLHANQLFIVSRKISMQPLSPVGSADTDPERLQDRLSYSSHNQTVDNSGVLWHNTPCYASLAQQDRAFAS